MELQKQNIHRTYCGVPQCKTSNRDNTSMHHIPPEVLQNKSLSKKWSVALRMEKPFSKYFRICGRHFAREMFRTPNSQNQGTGKRALLVKGAIPSLNLPKSTIITTKLKIERARNWTKRSTPMSKIQCNTDVREEEPINDSSVEGQFHASEMNCVSDDLQQKYGEPSVDEQIHTSAPYFTKSVRHIAVQTDRNIFVSFTSYWDTEKKLKTMTGLDNFSTLDALVNGCEDRKAVDKMYLSMKDRVLLTMYKLKSNLSFSQIAVSFNITDKSAKKYFSDTIQLLAGVARSLIHWQSKEENNRNLPACFENLQNIRTTLRCLSCKTCTYSHYKGTHTLKVIIGVSPSGLINYLSKVSTDKSSDKAIFSLTDLIDKLQPGDAVMVDKGLLIGDELSKAGIDIIRPEFYYQGNSREDVKRMTNISSARVHVERKIARLKTFNVFSETVDSSVISYMDDIMVVICGLSNLGSPILSDDEFRR